MIEVARRNATVEIDRAEGPPGGPRPQARAARAPDRQRASWHQVLVFTRTKHGANKLAEQLDKDGITALRDPRQQEPGARAPGRSPTSRTAACRCWCATDIAARGLDIDQLPHVVNFDLPNVPEDYVHRIGRTGRAGATGEAISLVCVDEHEFLRDIERLIKREIPNEIVAGFEPDPRARAEPILQRQGRGAPAGQGRGQQRHGASPGASRGHPKGGGHAQARGPADAKRAPSRPRADGTGKPAQGRPAQPSPKLSHALPAAAPKTGAPRPAARAPAAKPAVVHRFGGRNR